MKRSILTLGLLLAVCAVAPAQNEWWNNDPSFVVPISGASVVATRPIREIGLQKTKLDSIALRENIALSMSDVLTFNSSIFVKQYGRGTLSTVAFRGTSASHTQVSWNGMKINSPMLGMTDFSTIPSYFIDDASLLHGSSSVGVSGGGLGGAVVLSTKPSEYDGLALQAVQGIGSFGTFDEFLRLTYGNRKWQTSTRAVYSSSRNNFTYHNYNKKLNVYDENHKIVSSYYPIDTNRCGALKDFHILQEAYYNTGNGDRFGINAWYMSSVRGVPLLSVDYRENQNYVNQQGENTFRGVLSWDRSRELYKLHLKGGYTGTRQNYDFTKDKGNGQQVAMVESRSRINTLYGQGEGDIYLGSRWLLTAQVAAYQHFVNSVDRNAMALSSGGVVAGNVSKVTIGYNQARFELLSYISAKWTPTPRLGLSAALREELYGENLTPLIPAFFADYLICRKGNLRAKASVSRNYKFPSLNDLYFLPGGNPELKPEHGLTYDSGLCFALAHENKWSLNGEVTWFDSYIDDWIVWIPTFKGYWTPENVKQVHAYGIETKGNASVQFFRDWQLNLTGSFSWTPSINNGDPSSWADEAIGKQLVYVPLFSSSVNGSLAYRSWRFTYKWCYYSERFTTSDNDIKTKI
ncbi:MAG: TonB-dependent receptor plug domain-containing protein, partial [Bacteroidales bacterium]|nr:TonB-dependent receptor plug domain-containing protein [Bacteroidales bacterium]